MKLLNHFHHKKQIMFRFLKLPLHQIIECAVIIHFRNIFRSSQFIKNFNRVIVIFLSQSILSHCAQIVTDSGKHSALIKASPGLHKFVYAHRIQERDLIHSVGRCQHNVFLVCIIYKLCITDLLCQSNTLAKIEQRRFRPVRLGNNIRLIVICVNINMRQMIFITILHQLLDQFCLDGNVLHAEKDIVPS